MKKMMKTKTTNLIFFFLSFKRIFFLPFLTFFPFTLINLKPALPMQKTLINFFLKNNQSKKKLLIFKFKSQFLIKASPSLIFNIWENVGHMFQNLIFWNISLFIFQTKNLPLDLIPVSWAISKSIISLIQFYRFMFIFNSHRFSNLWFFYFKRYFNPLTTVFIVPNVFNSYWLKFFFKKKFFFLIGLGSIEYKINYINFLIPVYCLSPLVQWFFFHFLLFNMRSGFKFLFFKNYKLLLLFFNYYELFNTQLPDSSIFKSSAFK